jgi:plastocyanin domain-containing protein
MNIRRIKNNAVLIISVLLIILGGTITAIGLSQKNPAPEGSLASERDFANKSSAGCACCGSVNESFKGTRGKSRISGNIQEATITVNGGYNPETIELKSNIPARLHFTKGTSYCDSVVVFPFLGVSIDVSSEPQDVSLPPLKPGIYEYTCGMNMLKGYIRVY